MSQHGIGIIGYGGFGAFLHKSWSNLKGASVIGIADQNVSNIPAGEFNIYDDWRKMIRDPLISIISIVTPPSTHAELAIASMKAGKHVLIEKPLATNLTDAREIINVSEFTGMKATVNYMLRFNPIVQQVVKWSESGVFGQLRRAVVENYAQDESLPQDHWFWDESVSGGIAVEHAVHFLDLVDLFAMYPIKHVKGASHNRNEGQEDQVYINVLYENGLIASHYHDFARPDIFESTTIRLLFDLLELELYGWIPIQGRVRAMVNPEIEKEIYKLPGFKVDQRYPYNNGNIQDSNFQKTAQTIYCGGKPYKSYGMITGTFALPDKKLDVYRFCVRSMIENLITSIDNPHIKLNVSLEDGFDTLKTALTSRESARAKY